MAGTTRWTVAVAAACSVLLGACSSDGGGSTEPQGVCTHAAVPASGPGDPQHYFPVDVGRTWTYEATESTGPFTPPVFLGTLTVTVGDPTTFRGEPVSVFTDVLTSPRGQKTSGTDTYAVRPAGVYLVAAADVDPPVDQALPELVIPFDVELTQTAAVTCQHLRFAIEGETFDVDLVEWVWPIATVAEMTVSAGTFTDVGVVTAQLEMTLRGQGQTIGGHIEASDWYAPGVGLIHEVVHVTARCYGCTVSLDILDLTSYAPVSTVTAAVGPGALDLATALSVPPADPLEALAQRAARRIARLYR